MKIIKVPLIASKLFRYDGKALRAGDKFMARRADARALTAARLAEYSTRAIEAAAPAERPPPRPRPEPPPAPQAPASDEVAALRTEFEARTGRKPHGRWGADRLRSELAAVDTPPPPAAETPSGE